MGRANVSTMSIPTLSLSPYGPLVSRLALGMWRLADAGLTSSQTLALVEGCLDIGVTTIDHADVYGDYLCEERFGVALAAKPSLRDDLQLITKCGIKLVSPNRPAHRIKHYDTSRAHIVASVENSLTRLRTERIDVLLIHRPDPLMDVDEVAQAFIDLKRAGKVLYFGVSNFSNGQFDLLASRLPFPVVTNQVEFSVLRTDPLTDGTFDQCQRLRIAPMAWSPLGGGRLLHGKDQRTNGLRAALTQVGAELGGQTPERLALAWVMAHPARVVPVIGTSKLERVRDAAAAADVSLTREQWFIILKAATGADVP